MINQEKFCIAPNSSRNYLIYKFGINLLYSVMFCLLYIDQFFKGKLPYSAAYIRCSFLFLLCIMHMCMAVLFVLLIPQLMTLYQNERRNEQILQLKKFLKYKLNSYLEYLESIKFILILFGSILLIWDSLTETQPETEIIVKFLRYQTFAELVKGYLIKKLENSLEEDIIEETQRCYIKTTIYTQPSSILLEDCPICYELFKMNDQVSEYQCQGKHKFHKECVVKWLKTDINKNKICPYCKTTPINL